MATANSTIEITFKLLNGIVLIPAIVNDEQGYLIFDTGAMKTALHKKHFPNIQGNELEIAKFNDEMENDTATEILIRSLSFSSVTLTGFGAMLMDLSYVEDRLAAFDPAVRILGTMGIDIIRRFSVMMDYGENRITLNAPHGFAQYTCVPMRVEALPVVEIEMEGQPYSFVLDTGANTCLLEMALQNRLLVQPMEGAPNVFSIPHASLQDRLYNDIVTVFADISAIQKKVSVDGVIGYQILSPQRVYFDFINQKLYLEKA